MAMTIKLIGNPSVLVDGSMVALGLMGPTLGVFCYLCVHVGKETRREKLASTFWPDRTDLAAGHLLATALWRIRKIIRTWPSVRLVTKPGLVRIEVGLPACIDTAFLSHTVENVLGKADRAYQGRLGQDEQALLLEAVGDSDEDFLEGHSGDWVYAERERFFNLRIRALTLLLRDAADRNEVEKALILARRIIALDPFRESTLRQLMWLYFESGQQARALRQFATYERLLAEEMGLRPMPETVALRELILRESQSSATDAGSSESHAAWMRKVVQDNTNFRKLVFATLSSSPE